MFDSFTSSSRWRSSDLQQQHPFFRGYCLNVHRWMTYGFVESTRALRMSRNYHCFTFEGVCYAFAAETFCYPSEFMKSPGCKDGAVIIKKNSSVKLSWRETLMFFAFFFPLRFPSRRKPPSLDTLRAPEECTLLEAFSSGLYWINMPVASAWAAAATRSVFHLFSSMRESVWKRDRVFPLFAILWFFSNKCLLSFKATIINCNLNYKSEWNNLNYCRSSISLKSFKTI